MSTPSPAKGIIRNVCTTITLVGLCMLGLVFYNAYEGGLVARYFPDVEPVARHHVYGLLLALPVPLHVIFIGLIIQKKWLTESMARFAWVGIVSSGMWLGASLTVRTFFL